MPSPIITHGHHITPTCGNTHNSHASSRYLFSLIPTRIDSYAYFQIRFVKHGFIGEIHNLAVRRAAERIGDRGRYACVISNQTFDCQHGPGLPLYPQGDGSRDCPSDQSTPRPLRSNSNVQLSLLPLTRLNLEAFIFFSSQLHHTHKTQTKEVSAVDPEKLDFTA